MGSIADGTEAADAGDAGGHGFALHRKAARRGVSLAELDKLVPSERLSAEIELYYAREPAPSDGGRCPIGLERNLCIHFVQQWYALSHPGVEETPCDSAAMRRFVRADV